MNTRYYEHHVILQMYFISFSIATAEDLIRMVISLIAVLNFIKNRSHYKIVIDNVVNCRNCDHFV